MRVENVEIYGLPESAVASGYPMLSEVITEEYFEENVHDIGFDIYENENDHIERLVKLGKTPSGSGHNCALKGVIVQYDLTCNHIMIPQFLRYNFHDIISSQSKMHRITKMDLKSCCGSRVKQDIINSAQIEIDKYLEMIKWNDKPYENEPWSKDQLQEQYEVIMENLPMGLELTMRITDNYLQLISKYKQRFKHKMSFWREYCKWIKTLPLMDKILIDKK